MTKSGVICGDRRRLGIGLLLAAATAGCSGAELVLPEDQPAQIAIVGHTPSPSDVGRAVSISVRPTPGKGAAAMDGTFRIGASTGEECSQTMATGFCEIVFNSPGERTLTATYLGTGALAGVESTPVTQVVNDVPNATRTTIGTAPDPASAGQPVTIYITVKGVGGGPAFGIVNVYGDGSDRCGTGQLLGWAELDARGQGTVTTTAFTPGFHVLRGCFAGSPGFAPSEDLASETVH